MRPLKNSKWKNLIRTMPSTLQKVKSIAQDLTPKLVICEASHSSDGIALAPSAGALPQNHQQVSNLRCRTDESHEPLVEKKKDPPFAVMNMCKESEGKSTSEHFVRIVTGAPEPVTVVE